MLIGLVKSAANLEIISQHKKIIIYEMSEASICSNNYSSSNDHNTTVSKVLSGDRKRRV